MRQHYMHRLNMKINEQILYLITFFLVLRELFQRVTPDNTDMQISYDLVYPGKRSEQQVLPRSRHTVFTAVVQSAEKSFDSFGFGQ